MNIPEFKNSVMLIRKFSSKMERENVPTSIQKILIKVYANTLKINLTDRMIDDIK